MVMDLPESDRPSDSSVDSETQSEEPSSQELPFRRRTELRPAPIVIDSDSEEDDNSSRATAGSEQAAEASAPLIPHLAPDSSTTPMPSNLHPSRPFLKVTPISQIAPLQPSRYLPSASASTSSPQPAPQPAEVGTPFPRPRDRKSVV